MQLYSGPTRIIQNHLPISRSHLQSPFYRQGNFAGSRDWDQMYLGAIIQPTILAHTTKSASSAKSVQNIFQLDLGFELRLISHPVLWVGAHLDDLIQSSVYTYLQIPSHTEVLTSTHELEGAQLSPQHDLARLSLSHAHFPTCLSRVSSTGAPLP